MRKYSVAVMAGGTIVCQLPELFLLPGRYRLNVALYARGELQDHVEAAAYFTVEPGELRGRPVRGAEGHGGVHFPHVWRFDESVRRADSASVSR